MDIVPTPMLITTRSLISATSWPGKPNTYKLTGGTGKFQGLQALIIITSMPVKSTYERTLRPVTETIDLLIEQSIPATTIRRVGGCIVHPVSAAAPVLRF